MPQPRRDAVHRFYLYDASNKSSKCNLCGNSIKGKHTTNLKNHISSKHVQEYLYITKENRQHQPSTSQHSSTSDQVISNCVKLVTVHGRPLALIQDKAFQEIINIAVPSNIQNKHINIKVIEGMITEKAYQIKLKIASEIRNNLISLKLDSASYLDKNFLGINIQYIKDSQITVRNLAVIEIIERQTGDLLKEKVLEVLNDFMISTAQIYSITTDNGSNFKRMAKLLAAHCSTAITEDININTDMNSDCEIDDENDDDEDNDDVAFGTDTPLELDVDAIINVMRNESFKPRSMFCAAHTLQLAVKDAIADNIKVQRCIELARKAVKILRRPTMKNFIKSKNLNKPIIDCPTRWSSTYQMLLRLVSLKDICDSQSELAGIYSDDFWTQITEVLTCLKPINEATEALQREQLTIGDFYIAWLNCKAKLELIPSIFANELVIDMKLRERTLLNADVVLESLYLDGRLNVLLSDQDCIKAQKLILETYRQLQSVTSLDTDTQEVACTSRHEEEKRVKEESENSSYVNDVLEKQLQEAESLRGLPERTSNDSFEGMLRKLRYEPRVPLDSNILAHWSNKYVPKNPTLLNVANCVLAAPATQVSVKRLFSSVKFILNPLRSNISSSLLQDIMLIRSNHDLFT